MGEEISYELFKEEELWKSASHDDEKAFRKLFELFYPPLCQYIKRYVEDQATREDIVQEVFASLWEDRKKTTISISFRSYLIACVKHQCLSHLRRTGYMQQYVEIQQNETLYEIEPNEIYLLHELQELLEKTLSKLPEIYRLVFEMNRIEGKSFDEIAETLNISVRTAKRYKSKVTDVLKEDLKDYLPLLGLLYPHLIH